jgi:formylmethanofuran dehydrogenase subunit E
MVSVLEDMANEIEKMHDRLDENDEYMEAIDEDLADVESMIYDDDEEPELVEVDDVYDETNPEAYDDDEVGYFEVECPNCHEMIAVDSDVFQDEDMVTELVCPECEHVFVINDDAEEESRFQNYVIDTPEQAETTMAKNEM